MKIRLFSNGAVYEVQSVGYSPPRSSRRTNCPQGDVGYIIAGIKKVSDAKIGDTITDADQPADAPLPGYKEVKPMVFCGHLPDEQRRL